MVRPPFHVSVCPSPALGLGWFGHRSVAPPAAPGCWALLESRLRRSDALASDRTLSFYFLAGDFFLGRLLGLELVGCDPAWVPTFFWGDSPSLVRGFRWAVPAVWLSRLLVFSWNLYLGSFLSLPVFAAGLRWFKLILGCPPSVAWRWRLLPWFFVRYLSACPRGATVPLDSLVLWGSWSFPSCGVPCLRLTLWAAACVGPGGCPAFSRVGPPPLSWVPLLWTWLVWEAPTVFLLHCLPSGCGHPFGSIVSFVTINRERRFPLGVVSCTM